MRRRHASARECQPDMCDIYKKSSAAARTEGCCSFVLAILDRVLHFFISSSLIVPHRPSCAGVDIGDGGCETPVSARGRRTQRCGPPLKATHFLIERIPVSSFTFCFPPRHTECAKQLCFFFPPLHTECAKQLSPTLLRALTADTTRELDVLRHDGHALRMNGAKVGILEETHEISLSRLLEREDRMGLESEICSRRDAISTQEWRRRTGRRESTAFVASGESMSIYGKNLANRHHRSRHTSAE
jgi:hypothetical protein